MLEAWLQDKEGFFEAKFLLAKRGWHLLTDKELRTIKQEVRTRVTHEKDEEFQRKTVASAKEIITAKWQRAQPRAMQDEWCLPQYQLAVEGRVYTVQTKLTCGDLAITGPRRPKAKSTVSAGDSSQDIPKEPAKPRAEDSKPTSTVAACPEAPQQVPSGLHSDYCSGMVNLFLGPDGDTEDKPIIL
jgi:hypothetical protein